MASLVIPRRLSITTVQSPLLQWALASRVLCRPERHTILARAIGRFLARETSALKLAESRALASLHNHTVRALWLVLLASLLEVSLLLVREAFLDQILVSLR